MILGQVLGQIAQAPTHHAVGGGGRPLFEQGLEDLALLGAQARTGTGGPCRRLAHPDHLR
jgi:hypothetical protein